MEKPIIYPGSLEELNKEFNGNFSTEGRDIISFSYQCVQEADYIQRARETIEKSGLAGLVNAKFSRILLRGAIGDPSKVWHFLEGTPIKSKE